MKSFARAMTFRKQLLHLKSIVGGEWCVAGGEVGGSGQLEISLRNQIFVQLQLQLPFIDYKFKAFSFGRLKVVSLGLG